MKHQNLPWAILLLVIGWLVLSNRTPQPAPAPVTVPPPSFLSTATTYPTVAVTALPTGNGSDTLGAAATAVPTNVPSLKALFSGDEKKIAGYWNQYHASGVQNWIITAYTEGVGTNTEKVQIDSHSGLLQLLSTTRVSSTVKITVMLATSATSVVRNIEVEPGADEKSLTITVELPPEVAYFVGVPASTDPARKDAQDKSGQIALQGYSETTTIPPRYIRGPLVFFTDYSPDLVSMSNTGEGKAALVALDWIVQHDLLHQKHVLSVEQPGADNAYDTIAGIARDAVCSKLKGAGKSCDVTMTVIVKASPAPKQLLWAGSGFPVSNLDYASIPYTGQP